MDTVYHNTITGFTAHSNSDKLTVTLRVDKISTNTGSMEGGTKMTIIGEGFGDNADNVCYNFGDERKGFMRGIPVEWGNCR